MAITLQIKAACRHTEKHVSRIHHVFHAFAKGSYLLSFHGVAVATPARLRWVLTGATQRYELHHTRHQSTTGTDILYTLRRHKNAACNIVGQCAQKIDVGHHQKFTKRDDSADRCRPKRGALTRWRTRGRGPRSTGLACTAS